MEDNVEKCPSCNGVGKIDISQHIPPIGCLRCNGSGRGIYVLIDCPSCQGAIGLPCSLCGGGGKCRQFRAISVSHGT